MVTIPAYIDRCVFTSTVWAGIVYMSTRYCKFTRIGLRLQSTKRMLRRLQIYPRRSHMKQGTPVGEQGTPVGEQQSTKRTLRRLQIDPSCFESDRKLIRGLAGSEDRVAASRHSRKKTQALAALSTRLRSCTT